MLLDTIEIKNYRSLEYVKLENLQHYNVLIGRNNAGKSSVFLALQQLGQVLRGQMNFPPEVLTDRDANHALEIQLTFKPNNQEREAFIDLLIAAGFNSSQREKVLQSPFFRMVQFSFRSAAGSPHLLHLRETKLLTQDNKWVIIQHMVGDERVSNPQHKFLDLGTASKEAETALPSHSLNIEGSNHVYEISAAPHQLAGDNPNEKVRVWLFSRLYHYFSSAYFFNPFRHSESVLNVQSTLTLAQNGSNLAQVLHTIIANDRDTFDKIEQFVHGALPDVGRLQTPLNATQTNVVFRVPQGGYNIPLTDMGGGIEQLLMVATVLLTTTAENAIFIEEPESHLHAGAQRYLIEKLYDNERQVFITTHSSTFINLNKPFSLYQVLHRNGRTQINRCDPEALEAVLEDIDVRNSDVLFSDAILFVEGPGDRDVLTIFSEKLNMNVAERNVNVLPMGGGKHAERGAPIRSDLLRNISRKATVPHIFLLDRDERSNGEILNLEEQLGEQLHLFQARELENYLLVPRAILSALKEKHRDDRNRVEQLEKMHEEQVQQFIINAANDLYGTVLIKRIRCEIGGLREGLLPKETVPVLSSKASNPELSTFILKEIKARFEGHLATIQLDAIIASEKEILNAAWAIPVNRLQLAPGEEILREVFCKLSSKYQKPKDTTYIAREMRPDEIDDEIKDILKRVYELSPY